jgi:hypothetical protein
MAAMVSNSFILYLLWEYIWGAAPNPVDGYLFGALPQPPPKNFLKKVFWNFKNIPKNKQVALVRCFIALQDSSWGPFPICLQKRFKHFEKERNKFSFFLQGF